MKNKLLSVVGVLLLSCQYAPTQAQVVDSAYGKAYFSNEFSKQVYVICVGDRY